MSIVRPSLELLTVKKAKFIFKIFGKVLVWGGLQFIFKLSLSYDSYLLHIYAQCRPEKLLVFKI